MTVYFLQAGPRGPIKIGYAKNVRGRLGNIQCHNHAKLICCGTMEGNRKTEAAIHKMFAKHLVRGEWFRPCQEIRQFMRGLAPLPPKPKVKNPWTEAKRKSWLRANGRDGHKKIGSRGGLSKGVAQSKARDAILSRKKVIAVVRRLGYLNASRRLGLPYSESTLRRNYVP